jgi:hypothetical protein
MRFMARSATARVAANVLKDRVAAARSTRSVGTLNNSSFKARTLERFTVPLVVSRMETMARRERSRRCPRPPDSFGD